MKNIFFLILFAITSTSYAQTIQNTEWDLYLFGDLAAGVRFSQDTFYISTFEDEEFPIATYYTLSDTFAITDLETAEGCFDDYGNVEGMYFFEVQNDTLTFSVIQDSCEIRVETLDFAILVAKDPTSVENLHPFGDIALFPNPITDGILNIKSDVKLDRIEVYDSFGKLLVSSPHTSTIDLSTFTQKVFIITLQKDGNITSRKVYKQ